MARPVRFVYVPRRRENIYGRAGRRRLVIRDVLANRMYYVARKSIAVTLDINLGDRNAMQNPSVPAAFVRLLQDPRRIHPHRHWFAFFVFLHGNRLDPTMLYHLLRGPNDNPDYLRRLRWVEQRLDNPEYAHRWTYFDMLDCRRMRLDGTPIEY